MNKVARLGEQALVVLEGLGAFVRFALGILLRSSALLAKPALWVRAMYQAGVLSLPIILVAGFFVGMVLAFQGFTTLVRFGAEQSLGIMVALSLMRELGSVVSALLFAGRAGSSITAEIGLMKTTEQLSAMEMMAIDPMVQVGLPRFWGAMLALPLLVVLFVAVAIVGAYVVGVLHLGVDAGVFWSQMQQGVDFYGDIFQGMLVKSIAFGWVVAAIAVYQGFNCTPTARGMSNATTKTVVLASLAVLGLDFILTAMMFGG
ncbi:lipid asymmetry maintenance ABC transporter permease subunit MlaE [Rappaport israeli]|uniref:lipid asymmetry maintenance ABC transporter permease subunit MlaE n=1 Tax=Rappaport israeli TaxID=1839807 RepID=UPI0009319BFD|nr:lipid asymmetry maintenance ABC transporter permease subunit MlaE [Rappaport israeli]